MNIISLHSAPRSGSTWLQTIFEADKHTKTLYQPLFSYKFKNRIDFNSTKDDFQSFINELINTDDEFCLMKSDYHTNKGQCNQINFNHKEEIKNIFIKNVHHHYLIEKFIQLEPSIKIIGLIRDPYSVIYSQMHSSEQLKDWKDGSDKNNGLKENYFGFNKWKELRDLFNDLKEKYPENIIIVCYDQLFNDTENKIKEICDFCKIDFSHEMQDIIKELSSKEEDYDYSVYRQKNNNNHHKNNLDVSIIEYINQNL